MIGDHKDDAARRKMNSIARLLIGMSLLVLFDGAVSAASAFPAGRFISAMDLTRDESAPALIMPTDEPVPKVVPDTTTNIDPSSSLLTVFGVLT